VSRRYIAVIKADSDQGFSRAVRNESITLTYINDMILGASQRLFKVALFIEYPEYSNRTPRADNPERRTPEEFLVKVFDHLLQNSGDRPASQYFYNAFLKCRQADNASRLTKKFFETVRDYIESMPVEAAEKIELRGDLIGYMRGNRTTVEPREFALEILPPEHQDNLIRRCREAGIDTSVSKNLELLKGKLRRQSVKFSSNVTIYAPPEVFRESIRIERPSVDGWTNVRIRGLAESTQ
jgi:hypothetical protein